MSLLEDIYNVTVAVVLLSGGIYTVVNGSPAIAAALCFMSGMHLSWVFTR